jgi:TRAP-type C4-dicarboxylate transport system permease small subunit
MNWSFSRIAMWGPAFIVAIIFYEVVMRYIFFKPTLWVNEMSLWIGGGIYVTAGLYAMQQRSHIRIFVLYDMAPLWLRRVFDILSVVCVCIFVFAVVWGGFGEAAAKFWRWEAFGTAFDPPIPATNKPLILVTLFVLSLQAISNLIRDWPSSAIVRKTFDVISVLLILWLAYRAIPIFTDFSEEGPKMPMRWRIGMGGGIVAACVLMVYGLVRDFNRAPVPFSFDEDEEMAAEMRAVNKVGPDNVLTGNPPRNNSTAGK